ncbi:MAG: hypothetical protein PVI03_01420 [Candidatus Thorarchaeota archaeon]|jgi:hypothetical protein
MARRKQLTLEAVLEGQRKGMKVYKMKSKPRLGKNTVKVEGKRFTMKDLANFFKQARGFPTILRIGDVWGEGQSGGRYVSEVAHRVENKFVQKYGIEEYRKKMRKIMGD